MPERCDQPVFVDQSRKVNVMAYELCRKSTLVAIQNDSFRKSLGHPDQTPYKGTFHITKSVQSLPEYEQARLYLAIASFDDFSESNDTWGEHDYGVVGSHYFKIDYYDSSELEHGSADSSDPACTFRLVTIALLEEY